MADINYFLEALYDQSQALTYYVESLTWLINQRHRSHQYCFIIDYVKHCIGKKIVTGNAKF